MNKLRKRPVHWMPGDSAISACGRMVTTPVYIAKTEIDVTCSLCDKILKKMVIMMADHNMKGHSMET